MNCKRTRLDIALMVGDDLDEGAEAAVRRHVAACPDCCEHLRRMQRSLGVLHEPNDIVANELSESVWPALAAKLPGREAGGQSGFNGWVPATALAAACLAVVMFVRNGPTSARQTYDDPLPARSSLPVWRVEGPPPRFNALRDSGRASLFGPGQTQRREVVPPPDRLRQQGRSVGGPYQYQFEGRPAWPLDK